MVHTTTCLDPLLVEFGTLMRLDGLAIIGGRSGMDIWPGDDGVGDGVAMMNG